MRARSRGVTNQPYNRTVHGEKTFHSVPFTFQTQLLAPLMNLPPTKRLTFHQEDFERPPTEKELMSLTSERKERVFRRLFKQLNLQ